MNCSKNCGVPGRCDRITGQCEGVCQVGWKGATCESGKNMKIKLMYIFCQMMWGIFLPFIRIINAENTLENFSINQFFWQFCNHVIRLIYIWLHNISDHIIYLSRINGKKKIGNGDLVIFTTKTEGINICMKFWKEIVKSWSFFVNPFVCVNEHVCVHWV